MAPLLRPRRRARRRAAACLLVVALALAAGGGSPALAATLDQPTDIVCAPFENTGAANARVVWGDASTGETGYRVQRSIDGGSFATIADIGADQTTYDDSGLDPTKVYRYRVLALDGGTAGPVSDACRQVAFLDSASGNFRVYFRPYPAADCPPRSGQSTCVPTTLAGGVNEYGARIGTIMEGTRTALSALGFDDFASYANGKPMPVDLVWCDGGGCAGADAWGDGRKGGIGLAPVFMGPYDPVTGLGDPSSVLIALHEGFHQQQFTYGGVQDDPAGAWVFEGQARSIQDKVCVGPSAGACTSLDAVPNGAANYLGEVAGYLNDPARSVTRISYASALFWTYLLERFGTVTTEPQRGMDLMREFWEQAEADRSDTGIGTIDRTLQALGRTERFDDVFRDFVVANYAKDLTGPSVPAKYRYVDESQQPGSYGPVARAVNAPLALGAQIGPTLDDVPAYGARYYEIAPSADVPMLDVRVSQDTSNPVHYSLLLIKDGDLVQEIRGTGPDFAQAVPNDDYDRVVLVVAGLGNLVNYRYSFNATQPVLSIEDPLTNRQAQAGTASSPRKVLVKASLLSASGDPVEGLDASAFSVTIGSQAVAADQIVSSSFVQGQYWLLVQAPTQLADGAYDLTVGAAGLTASQPSAVLYGPPPRTDNEIVIDRSSSMNDFDKLEAARSGALLYLDTWEESDEAGLVSFNQDATVDEDLDPITDGHRTDLRTAINGLTGSGSTAIGDGLLATLPQLDDRGDQGDEWAVVVLSDGLETADKRIDDFLGTYDARKTAGTKNPRVHTIALGPDADRENMQRLADRTGGTYQFASVSTPSGASTASSSGAAVASTDEEPETFGNRMAAVFRQISEEIAGEQQVFLASGAPPATNRFRVDGGTSELTVALRADTSDFTPVLMDPHGVIRPPTRTSMPHAFWRIPSPARGEWTLAVQCGLPCASEYVTDAAVTSTLRMDGMLGLAPEDRQVGRVMPILATTSDTGPVHDVSYVADVTAPDGSTSTLALHDDGQHGDGKAGDGLFGALYTATQQANDYVVVLRATGTSAPLGDFTRRARLSFELTPGADSDGDGLPDWWEQQHGTDAAADDAGADPDRDGSSNTEELDRATDPRDPDSDDGGESDGTDLDPLRAGDDRLPAPSSQAYGGVGEISVKHSTDPAYTSVRIERGPTPDGPFTTIAAAAPVTGLHTDTTAANGEQWCYVVTGQAGAARSAPADPTCATAAADPVPPHGGVVIDEGADASFDHEVRLDLIASDLSEPEIEHPAAPPFPEGAVPSGVTEMMISNSPAFAGATWEPYAPVKQWTVAPVDERATVYVRYRDGAGNVSESAHASITVLDLSTCDISGTTGNDRITGTDASEVICGFSGNDHIDGRGGMDAILAGAGNDQVVGGPAGDLLVGDAGNDTLRGNDGDDIIRAGTGNDDLRGEAGDDELHGDEGIDDLRGGSGADALDGGPGADVVHRDGEDDVTPDPDDRVVHCSGPSPC